MTIKQALIKYSKLLKDKKITFADLDAEVILAYILKKPKEYLFSHSENNLTTKQLNDVKAFIQRRVKGEPVAYLTNHKEFFGLDFYVDKRVLIPRPETEILVEEVIKYVNNKSSRCESCSHQSKARLSTTRQKLTICDIGTGSGCIAISLAKHLPHASIMATDISKPALNVAKKNAQKHNVKIKFLQSDLLESVSKNKIDILIANLPYLDDDYKYLLPSFNIKSLKYEPQNALMGGPDGLDLYRRLFKQIKASKYNNLTVFTEIDPRQKVSLTKYILKLFPQSKITFKKDLAGFDRLLIIRL